LWAGRQGTAPLPESEVNAKPISYAQPRGDAVTTTGTEWHNPDTDDSGRIEPLRTYVGGAQRNEKCRQFRETYFKNGEPVVATEQACQNAQGQWQ
jgi:surface antigen